MYYLLYDISPIIPESYNINFLNKMYKQTFQDTVLYLVIL